MDPTSIGMFALLVALAALAWWRGGVPLLEAGLGDGARLLLRYGLLVVMAFFMAGLVEKVVPHAWVSRALGEDAGIRGIALAALAGTVTPSGPFVSMPLAAALLRSGAGTPAVVAFVSAWALLAIHRFVAWEVPFLGLRFAVLRWSVCAVLPVLAGLAVRALGRSGSGL